MVLGYYGLKRSQGEIAVALHPDPKGKHVGAAELAGYLAAQGLVGKAYVNGNPETLQRFIANGIPVLVAGWLKTDEDIGHYRLVKGYARTAGVLLVNDSYLGPDLRYTLAQLEAVWWPFNRLYIPIYRPERAGVVQAILGEDMEGVAMFRRAQAAAQEAIHTRPTDAYAWFNLGDDLLGLDDAPGAIAAYEKAMQLGLPERMLWYRVEPLAAYNRGRQHQRVLDLSAPLLARTVGLAQVYEQRGHAYLAMGQTEKAAIEYRQALFYAPGLVGAREGLEKIPHAR